MGKTVYASNVSDANFIYQQVLAIQEGNLVLFDANMQSVFEKCESGGLFILPVWFEQRFPNLHFLPFSPPVPFYYQVVYRKEHSPGTQKLVNAYLEFDANL